MERSTLRRRVYTKPTGIALRRPARGRARGRLRRGVIRRLCGVRRARVVIGPCRVFLRFGLGFRRLLAGADALRRAVLNRLLFIRRRPERPIRAFLTIGSLRRGVRLAGVLCGLTGFTDLDLVMVYAAFFRG
jgi:hypothetical protein